MTEEKGKAKGRPIWMKVGSYKYLLELLKAIKRELHMQRKTLRYLVTGLQGQLYFDKDFIASAVCADEVDLAILNFLRDRSTDGVLPRDIAREMQHDITPWNVTLRIRRMNKKLDTRIGQQVAEKRGLCWCLTSFMELSWTEEEPETENLHK